MSIPAVVQKQAEEADKKWQEVYGNPEESAPEEPEPAAEPEPDEPVSEEPPEAKSEDWEHKYRVIEGKYRAEVPRLHQENRAIREQLEALQQQIQTIQRPVESTSTPDFKLLDDYFDKDTKQQLDAYIEQKVQRRLQDVEGLVQQTRQMSAQTAEQAFWKDVLQKVPDYAAVSNDPAFGDWLNQPMPMTPYTRYQLMMDAYQSGSADRYAEFITAYRGNKEPAQPIDPALRKKAIPPKAASGTASPGEGKRMYSREEYAKLGERVRQAQQQGRREEVKKLMSEMDAVVSERRIQL